MNIYSSVSCPGCPVDQRLMPTKGCGRPLLGYRCPTTATEASPLISFLASSFLPGFLSLQHRSRQGFCTNTWVGSSCWLHCVAIGGCFASPSGWNISICLEVHWKVKKISTKLPGCYIYIFPGGT